MRRYVLALVGLVIAAMAVAFFALKSPPPKPVSMPTSLAPKTSSTPNIDPVCDDSGNCQESMPVESNVTEPISNTVSSSGDERIWCLAVQAETDVSECSRFTTQKEHVEDGLADVKPPPKMTIGEGYDIRLAVGRKSDRVAVAAIAGDTPDAKNSVSVPVGEFMTASLSGGGFEIKLIDGRGEQRKLGADRRQTWTWHVVPKERGTKKIFLNVSVDAVDTNQNRTEFSLASKSFDVQVDVTQAQSQQEASDRRVAIAMQAQKEAEAYRQILLLIGGIIVALGSIWLAIRTFGKSKSDTSDAGRGN